VNHRSGNRLDSVAGAHATARGSVATVSSRGRVAAALLGRGMIVGGCLVSLDRSLMGVCPNDMTRNGFCQCQPVTGRSSMRRGNQEDPRGYRKQNSNDEARQPQG